jgi:hypothetical protein
LGKLKELGRHSDWEMKSEQEIEVEVSVVVAPAVPSEEVREEEKKARPVETEDVPPLEVTRPEFKRQTLK